MKEDVILYISNFILGSDKGSEYIHYGYDETDKPIRIIPSGFMEALERGENLKLPSVPLEQIDGEIPYLFGINKSVRSEKGITFYQDMIASAFFLLSRCEEAFFDIKRDMHGRPVGKESFVKKAGLLDRPIIDEYGVFLRNILKELGIDITFKSGIKHVYLTHDVDHLWYKYSLINGIKESARRLIKGRTFSISPMLNSLGIYKWNDCDTFDWLFQADKELCDRYPQRCKDIYFLLGVESQTDMTDKYWDDFRYAEFISRLKNNASTIGIHTSYEAGMDSSLVFGEVNTVMKTANAKISANRNHYLISNSIEWLSSLEAAGITDDFTMGYADLLGFRLGTTRAVRWIEPQKFVVHDLILHPLTIMDATLCAKQYMNLDMNSLRSAVTEYIEKVFCYGGDFTFLLHNTEISKPEGKFWKKLYPEIIDLLISKME